MRDEDRTPSNAANLERALVFLEALARARTAEETGAEPGPLPETGFFDDGSAFAEMVRTRRPAFDEWVVLLLALAPHVRPGLLDAAIGAGLTEGRDLPQVGGRRDRDSRALFATGETACFLLAGDDLEARFSVQRLFGPDHWFARDGVLRLEPPEVGAPILSGRLIMERDWIERLTLGAPIPPSFSVAFPARRVTAGLQWEDLVLDAGAERRLAEIRRWLRHRRALADRAMPPGRLRPGFRALFHGPPGAGKTLAAGLLGKSVEMEVYRVDLSAVVSKYIGETEKNLSGLFDSARTRDWVLFFDEADALFGKRTAVKDAHDRYANQEVAYLLQRVEDHDGLVILATNLRANMDEAFLGRFDAIVRFSLPDIGERRRIWLSAMPRDPAPEDPEAFAAVMARFELSGRAIVGALQFAALAALDAGSPVLRLEDAVTGARRELEKEGRIAADVAAAEVAAERVRLGRSRNGG